MNHDTAPVASRYDLIVLVDVEDGNPNGDPDAGNAPRIDPDTLQGLITDVAIKRRVRDWVATRFGGAAPNAIYVSSRSVLNDAHAAAWRSPTGVGKEPPTSRGSLTAEDIRKARAWMCRSYWDVRTFGAVMNTELPAGQVRGPVQLTFGRSVDPISSLEMTIGRIAVTNRRDADKGGTFGRKFIVPYGLYVVRGFINPIAAQESGFSGADLAILRSGLRSMFELDRSANRGVMTTRAIHAFRHDHPLGSASAGSLFSRLRIGKRPGVAVARSYDDYEIAVDRAALPSGIEIEDWMTAKD
jgi:CRISPR-associated protein Csd2